MEQDSPIRIYIGSYLAYTAYMGTKKAEEHHRTQLLLSLSRMRLLLLDALEAGKYLPPDAHWQPHFNGEMIRFRDRIVGGEREGILVVADEITSAIVQASVDSRYSSYVMVGAFLDKDVELGRLRAERVRHAADMDSHYWAVFVLEDAVLVALGIPPSSCRLIGEIIDLQLPQPFVQHRVCAYCYAINSYHSRTCTRCQKPLAATGRLGG